LPIRVLPPVVRGAADIYRAVVGGAQPDHKDFEVVVPLLLLQAAICFF